MKRKGEGPEIMVRHRGWLTIGSKAAAKAASHSTDNRCMHCATASFRLKTCCDKSHEWCGDQCSPRQWNGYEMALNGMGMGLVFERVDKIGYGLVRVRQ